MAVHYSSPRLVILTPSPMMAAEDHAGHCLVQGMPMAGQSCKFGRRQRLTHEREFRRAFARRCSASTGSVVVFVEDSGLAYPRLGLSIARRVGSAVMRNRAKRCAREAFRLHQHELPAVDYVCVIRRAGYTATEFGELLTRLAQEAERRLAARRKGG